MEKGRVLVNVGDINLNCHSYKASVQIEGVTRRRSITRARRRSGIIGSENSSA